MKLASKTVNAAITTMLFAIAYLAPTMSKASAEDWCRINEHNLLSCGFASKEQCLAMTSGRTGECNPNPFPGKAAARHPIRVYSQAELMVCRSMKLDCVGGADSASSAYAYLPEPSKPKAHRLK